MTMTIPPQTEDTNVVIITQFIIDYQADHMIVAFRYGYKDASGIINRPKADHIVLDKSAINALMNATPPGNKTFKEWIRPKIYQQIANYLGVPVGQID